MTVLEFEKWVSEHYDELVQVSRIACNGQGEDALHTLIEGFCEGREKLPPWSVNKLTPGWFMHKLRDDYRNMQTVARHERQRMEAVATSYATLGPGDTHLDTKRDAVKKAQRRMRLKKKQSGTGIDTEGYLVREVQWDGPMPGVARWRFQTLRDDRLFIKRAIRSQAESIWAAVKRQAHGLERGYSYTEFGQEASK